MVLYLFQFSWVVETLVFTSVTVIKNKQYNRLILGDLALNWKYRPHRGREGDDFFPQERGLHPGTNFTANIGSCSMVPSVYVCYSICLLPHWRARGGGKLAVGSLESIGSNFTPLVVFCCWEVLGLMGGMGCSLIDRRWQGQVCVCFLFCSLCLVGFPCAEMSHLFVPPAVK